MIKEIRFPLILLGLYYLLGFAMRPFDLDETTSEILGIVIRIVLSVVLWRYVGARIRKEYFQNNWFVFPVVVFLVLFTIYQKFGPGGEHSLSFFSYKHLIHSLSTASTGLFEELLCRAALFFAILKQLGKKQVWKAVILTSLFFAIAHLPNMFRPEGVNFSVISQIVFAFGGGLLFQSLFIRFQNLFLVVVLHSLINYWGTFSRMYETAASSEHPTFTLSDIWSSAGGMLTMVLLVCLPVSYVILKGGSQKV